MFQFSSFFGGFGSGSSGFGLNSFSFSDYHMIKSGSYKKLMKAYFAEQKDATASKTSKTSKGNRSIIEKLAEEKALKNTQNLKNTQSLNDTTGLSKMKSQADSLKNAADAFDKSDVFKKENGEYDIDKVVKHVNDFVNKYNSTIDQSGKVVSKDISQQAGYMQSMTKTMSQSLAKAGITVGKDGKLSVNEDTLRNADMRDVKALFTGSHSYAAEIADKANAIASAAIRSSSIYSSDGMLYGSLANKYNNWV